MNSTLIQVTGYTLLHSAWQGVAVASLLALLLAILRHHAPSVRYTATCTALAMLLFLPLVTWAHLYRRLTADVPIHGAEPAGPATARDVPEVLDSITASHSGGPVASGFSLEQILPWVVWLWGLGVLVLLVRLAVGWIYTRRLRRYGIGPVPDEWVERLDRLVRRLQITRRVRLLLSSRVDVPSVVGYLRPVILFPAGLITGLPAWQVDAILAHELAHIRRHDALVNLLQCLAEVLLFYHPAVWWISNRIRAEREYCCDDVAVSVCGSVTVYGRALLALEERRTASLPWALAADGGSLKRRILRLAGAGKVRQEDFRVSGLTPLVVLLGFLGLFAIACSDLIPAEQDASVQSVELPADLQAMLTSRDTPGLVEALHAMREEKPEKALPLVEAAFRQAPAEMKESLVFVFAYFFTPEADAALMRIAKQDPSPDVRSRALWAFNYRLSGLGLVVKDPAAVTMEELERAHRLVEPMKMRNEPLCPDFRSIALDEAEVSHVRASALNVLRRSCAQDLSFYERIYRSTDVVWVKHAAVRAMPSASEPAYPLISTLLRQEEDPALRGTILFAMAQTNDGGAVPLLVEAARSESDLEVRFTAMMGLSMMSQAHPEAGRAFEELKRQVMF